MKWKPIREVAAAIYTAAVAVPGIGAALAGTGVLPWREVAIAAITAGSTAFVAWLSHKPAPPAA